MRKLGLGLTVIGLAVPSFLQAVGLGEISVDSYLNQPLVADIQLVSTSPSEVDSLQVKIAPDKIYQQIGIQRTGIHSQLDFKPVIKNGVPVITVTTTRAITEPFLNFVIEVAWPKGKLLREYTVLLDPPVFRQQQAPAVTAPAAVEPAQEMPETPEATEAMITEPEQPVVTEVPPPAEPLDSIPLAETFPVTEPVAVDSATTESIVTEETISAVSQEMPYQSGAEYEVQRGDTLYEIADSYRPDSVTVNQMMIALLRENPNAFSASNINRLKSGYIMRIPDEGSVDSISNAEALAEVKRQRALWIQYKERLAAAAVPQQPAIDEATESAAGTEPVEEAVEAVAEQTEKAGSELEIVVPDEESEKALDGQEGTVLADAGSVADLEKEVTLAKEQIESQARENEELRSRVGELEALLNDKDRLIELKDEELLDIQQKLGDIEEAAKLPAVTPETTDTTPEQTEAVEPVEAGEQAPAIEEQSEAAPAVEEPVAEEQVADEPVVEEPAAEEPVSEEPFMSASTELMPRIPIDTATETLPEQAVTESTTEPAAVVSEQEPAATESTQTAANDAVEEKPGFFKALLSNPNLLMGTGFGALLLAGLGWLVARRKNTAELEAPNITRAPTLEGFTRDDDFIGESAEAAKEDVAEIESLLDIPESKTEITPEDQVAEKAESQDELNDFIDTAFNIEGDAQPEDAVASLTTEDELDVEPVADEIEEIEAENLVSMEEAENLVEDQMASVDVDDVAPALDTDDVVAKLGTEDAAPALDAGDLVPELDAGELAPALDASAELTDFVKEEIPESDEVLAEADVYLAYGLNEQAIELLRPALLDHPERHDYRGKLLEALYAMEDKQGFLEEADTLKSKLGDSAASSTIWGRVVAMGKDIAPDSELYATDAAESASLADIAPKKPESIDIDLGSDEFLKSELDEDELKETVIRGEGTAEFAVPDNDLAYQDTQAIDPEDMALALEEFDLPEIDTDSAETLMMDGATLHGLELAPLEGSDEPEPAGDATDEFQFDASALEDIDNAGEMAASVNEAADDFVVQPDNTQVMDDSEIDEHPLNTSMEMTQVIDPDTAMTAQTDMTDLEMAKETLAINVLDEGEGEDEISLLTGEDEIDTKLDLAKAYIDMGDQEGAKDALDEVINSGSDEQRNEAEKLLQQIG